MHFAALDLREGRDFGGTWLPHIFYPHLNVDDLQGGHDYFGYLRIFLWYHVLSRHTSIPSVELEKSNLR